MSKKPENDLLLQSFLAAIADPTRLKIAGLLAVGPLSLDGLASRIGATPEELLPHLELLTGLGLVRLQAGRYYLDQAQLGQWASEVLAGTRPPKPDVDALSVEEFDRKVLREFLTQEGRIKAFPAQEKKFQVLLRYVLRDFELDLQYPEVEVNMLLALHHPDVAALRRSLVDYGYMRREKGIYWRV